MKAVRFHEHGGPEVLKYEDAPEPKIQANEVLVKIKTCALNHLDLWLRMGVRDWKLSMPHIVGTDISGEVAEVGSLVGRVKVGERVLLCPGISCGQCEACFKGLDSACRSYTLFGVMADGGYAEYVKSPEANVVPVPSGLTFDEAAAVPLVFTTAWHMLFGRAGLRPGSRQRRHPDCEARGLESHRHRRHGCEARKGQAARSGRSHQSHEAVDRRRSPPPDRQAWRGRDCGARGRGRMGGLLQLPRDLRAPRDVRRDFRRGGEAPRAGPFRPPAHNPRLLRWRKSRTNRRAQIHRAAETQGCD